MEKQKKGSRMPHNENNIGCRDVHGEWDKNTTAGKLEGLEDRIPVGSPYMKVEYIHGREHQVVEFEPTGELHGTSWVETMGCVHGRYYGLRYFVAGMLWGAVISWIVLIVRWL